MSASPCEQRPFDLPRSREIKEPLLASEHLATKPSRHQEIYNYLNTN